MMTVYLKADRSVEVREPCVKISDAAKVYCSDEQLAERIRDISLFTFSIDENGQSKVISILYMIEKISEQMKDEDILIHNIGTEDIVIQLKFFEKRNANSGWWKAAAVAVITFLGSAFSIMTYNEDVNTMGVFEKIADIFGLDHIGMQIMLCAYAVGIGAGVIIFFNHFGKHRITGDPTPMEVEMEKYESDVNDTWIQKESRKGKNIDIQ